MENLPQDIFLAIFDYLAAPDTDRKYARYAPVSRRFQHAVERRTFERFNLRLSGADHCLSQFAVLFRPAQPHRPALVKYIYLGIELPEYDDEACGRRESGGEKEENNRVFSDAVHGLFRALKSFDGNEDLRAAGGLSLVLSSVSAMSDHRYTRPDSGDLDIKAKRYRASLVRLRDADQLPTLSIVSSFKCGMWELEHSVDAASATDIASKLSGLRYVNIRGCDKDYLDIATRRTQRNGVAKSLYCLPRTIDRLDLEIEPTSRYDQSRDLPSLLSPSSPVDALSLSLHQTIQRTSLRVAHITTYVSPELLWPHEDSPGSPFWSNLEVLSLTLPLTTPGGHWYFKSDPNIASPDEFAGDDEPPDVCAEDVADRDKNTFRTIPDMDTLRPLLAAMARAIHHAPALRRLTFSLAGANSTLNPKHLTNPRTPKPRGSFELEYYAPGESGDGYNSAIDEKRRAIWRVGDWVAWEVLDLWWEAVGVDGLVIWEHAEGSNGNDSE